MTPASSTSSTFDDLYQTYGPELPGWFHRLGLSKEQIKDATQTLWLVVAENVDQIPAHPPDAKKKLSQFAANIAQKTKRHAVRDSLRHGATMPDELPGNVPNAEQFAYVRDLLDAIESLPEHVRDVFIENKILGLPAHEIGARMNLGEDAILVRVWNACAQLRKKLDSSDERKEKRGVLIAPADIEIPLETRAAFCAYWTMKGSMPQFGGPKEPPPQPPPPRIAIAIPFVPEPARNAMSKALQATLVLLLMLTSAGVVALYFFWNPIRTDTARAGLHVPQTPSVGEIKDVVDAYPSQAPAVPSARTTPPKSTPKSPQALDADALDKLDGSGLKRSGSGAD